MMKNFAQDTYSIAKANDLFKHGNYRDALSIYEKLAQWEGWAKIVRANIKICRKRLNLPLKLSIIVPVFNSDKYLEKCLQSILNQTEVSFELIIINDGSSDNSLNIIQQQIKKDKRIVLINNDSPSGNPGTPRNQGISIAKGKYIGFVDSDDWIDPNYYTELIKAIEYDKSDIAITIGYINHFENEENNAIQYKWQPTQCEDELYRYHESCMAWDKIYRTDFLKTNMIRFGETKAAVDVPFVLMAHYYMRKIGIAKTIGYHYRRENNSSVTLRLRKSSNCEFEIQAYKNIAQWCDTAKVDIQYKNIINYKKIRSYIYTLSIISDKEFHNFYEKIRQELQSISRNIILDISKKLNQPIVYQKFQTILECNSDVYFKKYRSVDEKKIKALTKPLETTNLLPSFTIEGTKSGILFFPDWSKTNPYQKLLYGTLAQAFGIRVKGYAPQFFCTDILDQNKKEFTYIHLHWLHSFFDVSKEDTVNSFIKTLFYAKKLGYKIIYTAHNIISHDSTYFEREKQIRRELTTFFDYIFVHGEFAKQRIINEIGVNKDKVHIIPHGTYEGYYPNNVTREVAREKLGIEKNKFVFLFLGNIKNYKGIDSLLDAYTNIRKTQDDVVLIIAGRVFDEESKIKIEEHANNDKSILHYFGFIDEQDLQVYYNASDLVILPYRHILTSGAALLSIAFHTPIVAPRLGCIPEIITEDKQGYLFNNFDEMLEKMQHAIVQYRRNSDKWKSSFHFTELNHELRWPNIIKNSIFTKIFSGLREEKIFISRHSRYQYALIRIIGNDLAGRHSSKQSYTNLEFILNNESDFSNCIKIWILNRIVDKNKLDMIINLLLKHDKKYIVIPYNKNTFSKIRYSFHNLPKDNFKLTPTYKTKDFRTRLIIDNAILADKNKYIINNNGARNRAIAEGIKLADWVFPWDGNCFLTDEAWIAITKMLHQRDDLQYHIVPMDRVLDNTEVLKKTYAPLPKEEPQVIFRKDAELRFNETLMYGFQPKVELLKKLGVPGRWDKGTRIFPWGNPMQITKQSYSYNYSWSGWCTRLFSGDISQETDAYQRAIKREQAIINFISANDKICYYENYNKNDLCFYNKKLLDKIIKKEINGNNSRYAKTFAELEKAAQAAFAAPLYSVLDKTTIAPSGDKHDYWHPAPYSWPNPATPDGLPYIYKDGERVPGTRMYEPLSNQYDRTSIQRVFDNTTALALAGYIFNQPSYTEKATQMIRRWFLDQDTAMNPHLKYAQVIMGKNGNYGTASGLIETKDMYYFLDAVRIVKKSSFWNEHDEERMLSWCKVFLDWLNTSEQGKKEVMAINNHGVAFDLQTYALASFIGNIDEMYKIVLRSLSRLKDHVDKNGLQPHEMNRTATAHYTAFNLHLWLNLNTLIKRTTSINLLQEQREYDNVMINPLKKAVSWLLAKASGDWPFEQIDAFDKERYQHIYHTVSQESPSIANKYSSVVKEFSESKVIFFPHDGIAPFWTLQG